MTDAAKQTVDSGTIMKTSVGPKPEKLFLLLPRGKHPVFSPSHRWQMLSGKESLGGMGRRRLSWEWFSAGWADPSRIGARLLPVSCLATSVPELSLDSGTLSLKAWRHRLGSMQHQQSQGLIRRGIGLDILLGWVPGSSNTVMSQQSPGIVVFNYLD